MAGDLYYIKNTKSASTWEDSPATSIALDAVEALLLILKSD
jgi:hypothetical protein